LPATCAVCRGTPNHYGISKRNISQISGCLNFTRYASPSDLRSLTIQGYVVFNAEELKEMLVCRWARPEKFSRSFSQLKISSRITRLCGGVEKSLLRLSELVPDGLDLPIKCTYDTMDSLEQLVIQFAGGENVIHES
jgi:hypothetical protein